MSSRALVFPHGTLQHLSRAEKDGNTELTALDTLASNGFDLGVVALPAVIEDSYYRLNNLPARLSSLYVGLDPLDPDEDIVEEAEPAAMRLLSESYLLDDLIDAIYASLASFVGPVIVRRAGHDGETARSRRDALLAVKRVYREDWTVGSVLDRLAVEGQLGVEARPVLVHPVDVDAPPALNRSADTVLGRDVTLRVADNDSHALTRVGEATS